MTNTESVLVADDEAHNRELLRDLLEGHGYRVLESVDGETTLNTVQREHPDLILLDVMMPAPDGFEVCERLKKDESTAPIPILLVTALSDRKSRLRGIRAGANDFITKPIDTVDTILRVRNSLRMKQLHDLAQERFEKLKEMEAMRQEMVNMLVHDFKTPLTSVLGYSKLLRYQAIDKLNEQELRFLDGAIQGAGRLQRMISSALDVSKLEAKSQVLDLEVVAPLQILKEARETVEAEAKLREIAIIEEISEVPNLLCDRELIRRVLENLIDNSLRHVPLEKGQVTLRLVAVDEGVLFEVSDNGVGIAPERLEQVFQPYQTSGAKGVSHGLGLTFCRETVELHNGEIGVESERGSGSRFYFVLPLTPRL